MPASLPPSASLPPHASPSLPLPSAEWIRDPIRRLHALPGLSPAQRSAYATWARRYLRTLAAPSSASAAGTAHTSADVLPSLELRRRPSPEALAAFLRWIADAGAPAAEQREAREALSFLHDVVLRVPATRSAPLPDDAVRHPSAHLSPAEQSEVLLRLRGANRLMARVAFAADLSPVEASELRVGDLTLPRPSAGPEAEAAVVVHDAAGRTVRRTPLDADLAADLRQHLRRVRALYERDRETGCAAVPVPPAVEEAFPGAEESWEWQMVFPASTRARDGRTGRSVRLSSGPGLFIQAIRSLSQTDRRVIPTAA